MSDITPTCSVANDPRYCDVCRFGATGTCDERCELRADALPQHLVTIARSMAVRYFDGKISSADAAARFAEACRSPFNGMDFLNPMHAEFDAAVSRLIDAA